MAKEPRTSPAPQDKQDSGTKALYSFEPIKGYPMLSWRGKRPFTSTNYYPAQLKEIHGEEVEGWRNKLYWGDNLQVMSHLLKEFRGRVDLIYIDPPFDSKADYKQSIFFRGTTASSDSSNFEEKQYTDIWTNDEYLQFMYERLIMMRELLAASGSVFIHCDYHKSHLLRMVAEEVFGPENLVNEIIWRRKQATSYARRQFGVTTDTIFWFSKGESYTFNAEYSKDDENTLAYIRERFIFDDGDGRRFMKSPLVNSMYRPNLKYKFHGINPPPNGWLYSEERMEDMHKKSELVMPDDPNGRIYRKIYEDTYPGQLIQNIWLDIPIVNPMAKERVNYPTQKPEALLERIIRSSTNPGDIVFDGFVGSGTTQAVATRLGRRCIGSDINLGAIQVTTRRLAELGKELMSGALQPELLAGTKREEAPATFYVGFEIYNVNRYEVFRNPVEARELLLEALEANKLSQGQLFDGERDGRMLKIMPVNRIATRADLGELISGMDLRAFEKRRKAHPSEPVERITLICMGHEPDLRASLEKELEPYKLDVEVLDILRDRQDLEFKRDPEARVVVRDDKVVIERFYPMNLLSKLSLQKEKIKDWRELVESIMIDWNYDGAVLTPTTVDIPSKADMVVGNYPVPENHGHIRLKITDLLSESWEGDVING